jgi:hypothetical protein
MPERRQSSGCLPLIGLACVAVVTPVWYATGPPSIVGVIVMTALIVWVGVTLAWVVIELGGEMVRWTARQLPRKRDRPR